jgi:hypothetical protein
MALTTADSILDLAVRNPPQRLTIKALSQDVFLRDPTANDRDEFDVWLRDAKGSLVGVRGVIAAILLCDETGKRLFSIEDAERLGQLPPPVLQDVFDVGTKLLALSDKETEEAAEKSVASP